MTVRHDAEGAGRSGAGRTSRLDPGHGRLPGVHTHGTDIKPRLRTCTECGRRIPVERLRLLPDTWTCVRCSETRKVTEDQG